MFQSEMPICHDNTYGRSRREAVTPAKGTHNTDSIIESKVIYYLEQCGLGV